MTAPTLHKVTLDEALDLAKRQMQVGNYRTAELTLKGILETVPDHFYSRYFLGLAKYHLGNIQEAIETLRNNMLNPEATAEFWCNFGAILTQDGKYDEALAAFDTAIRLDPDYPDPYWNKSNALWLAGRYEDAEKAAHTAINKAPDRPEAWVNLGMAQIRQDQPEKAIKSWEKALELRPDFILAWSNLGNALREVGRISSAEEKCRKALDLDPSHTQAMNNLANALLDQSCFEEAEAWYKKAIALKPDYAEAHNNLCVCLILQMRYEEAITEARYATLFQKDYAVAYMNLSNALRSSGRLEEAEKAIAQAVQLDPNSVEIKMDLADMLLLLDRQADADMILNDIRKTGIKTPRAWIKFSSVLERANKIDEALEAIDKAVILNPEMPEAYIRKGQIYHTANKIEEAEKNYQKALELQPDRPITYVFLAELCQSNGDLKKSKDYLDKARKIAPHTPSIYYTLSKTKKFTLGDPDFKALLEMNREDVKRGPEALSTLHFTLHAAYEHMGDYKNAFDHLKKANDTKKTILTYNHEHQVSTFRAIREGYTSKIADTFKDKGDPSDIPIFIVGMPRSGTTLTEQILAAHPDVYGAGELYTFNQAQKEFGGILTEKNCAEIGAWYVKEIKKLNPEGRALRITDKMPGNFLHIGQIVAALPNAKIIHCRRNPIDTCLSCYKQSFARGHYWSYKLEDLAAYHKLYEELMAHWRRRLPGKFLEIDYEETVGNLEKQARKLVDYVGLPWNDACLEPHKYKRSVLTASKTQVIRPVYKTSVDAWKCYESQLQPLISILEKN